MKSTDNIKTTIIRAEPRLIKVKIPLETALNIYEEKKELSCAEYEELLNSSKTNMKKTVREEFLKHFKLKPDSSGYEFVKNL